MASIKEKLKRTSRQKAFFSHLTVSLVIFAIITYLMYFHMYPQPLFEIDGGWQGFKILILVDIILGPCITLIIFNPKKEKLLLDVTIIATIQISSLLYGLHAIYTSRPAIVAYADDTIRTIPYSSLEDLGVPKKLIDKIPTTTPLWVYADIPRDVVHAEQLISLQKIDEYESTQTLKLKAMKAGRIFFLLDQVHAPYDQNISKMIDYKLSTERIGKFYPELKQQLSVSEQLIQVKGRYQSLVCAFNPTTKEFSNCMKSSRDFSWM